MNRFECARPGHFYAVGVGPGAPDLLTLRAARLIETADVIIAPRSEHAEESLALATVRDLVSSQEVIENVYPMERDYEKTLGCWSKMADLVIERCGRGLSAVQITIGDPLIYSTSSYLIELLSELMEEDRLHVVPGISAFQAAASRFLDPLLTQEDRLTIMPATNFEEVERALEHCETLVLYKVGPRLPGLVCLLRERGLLDRAKLVCRAEQGHREIALKSLSALFIGEPGYMSTVIVHAGRRQWSGQKV